MIPGLLPRTIFKGSTRAELAREPLVVAILEAFPMVAESSQFWSTYARKVGHWSWGEKLGCAFTNAGASKADVLAAQVIGRGWDEITETLHYEAQDPDAPHEQEFPAARLAGMLKSRIGASSLHDSEARWKGLAVLSSAIRGIHPRLEAALEILSLDETL